MKTYGRVEVELHHSRPRHWMEVSGHLQAPVALPRYPLDRRLGGPQSRSGQWRVEKHFFLLLGIEPQPFFQ
jgi:hypothetical protein